MCTGKGRGTQYVHSLSYLSYLSFPFPFPILSFPVRIDALTSMRMRTQAQGSEAGEQEAEWKAGEECAKGKR